MDTADSKFRNADALMRVVDVQLVAHMRIRIPMPDIAPGTGEWGARWFGGKRINAADDHAAQELA